MTREPSHPPAHVRPSGRPLPEELTSLILTVHSPESAPVLVYLDQFVWVQMLQGLSRGEAVATRIRDLLCELRDTDQLRVPLSASHYLETWHRTDDASRTALATLMRDVSRYDTIAPLHVVHDWSVTAAVRAAHGFEPVAAPTYLGKGVNHAFDSPTGRFSPVEWVATDTTPEGPPVDMGSQLRDIVDSDDIWEWINLAGHELMFAAFTKDGLDRFPQHRRGDESRATELRLRAFLADEPYAANRLRDFVTTDEFNITLDHWNDAADALGIDLHAFMYRYGPEAIRWCVRVVPSSNVFACLREMRLRNSMHPIDQHDLTDLQTLANAVPNCDVVVTERRWVHGVRQRRLDRLYRTRMLTSLNQLHDWLAAFAVSPDR